MAYQIMQAHGLSVFIIVATMLVTPLYILATYVFSGASPRKGIELGGGFTIFGGIMLLVCLSELPRHLGMPGNLIVPLSWLIPSVVLIAFRNYFFERPLSQHWLVGLQVFRVIGAIFLIEMAMGNLPGIFAYPAGAGDIIVAMVALAILMQYRNAAYIPRTPILFLVGIGMADFISAFFFGFTSSANPFQLFYPDVPNQALLFPTGMIPLFLVPYAIFFHTLSVLNSLIHGRNSEYNEPGHGIQKVLNI